LSILTCEYQNMRNSTTIFQGYEYK